jgi:dTDP-glucose pyrophosphorylase
MIVLIPMAGGEEGFKEKGYPYCKSLIEVQGKPLLEHVWENLQPMEADKYVFVIRKEDAQRHRLADVIRLMDPQAVVIQTENPTKGAACTALLAVEHIQPERELVVTNGDQIFTEDLGSIVQGFRNRKLDASTIVFDSIHPRWSFVRLSKEGLVVEAAEKRPISRLATAGFYYFRRGSQFVQAAMEMIRKDAHVNGQFYVCPTFNELILHHARIGVHRIAREAYLSLATPQGVEQYSNHLAGANVPWREEVYA